MAGGYVSASACLPGRVDQLPLPHPRPAADAERLCRLVQLLTVSVLQRVARIAARARPRAACLPSSRRVSEGRCAIVRVRRLPVVDDGKLVGVLSQADVALEGKDKEVGDVVQEISQPTSTPRES